MSTQTQPACDVADDVQIGFALAIILNSDQSVDFMYRKKGTNGAFQDWDPDLEALRVTSGDSANLFLAVPSGDLAWFQTLGPLTTDFRFSLDMGPFATNRFNPVIDTTSTSQQLRRPGNQLYSAWPLGSTTFQNFGTFKWSINVTGGGNTWLKDPRMQVDPDGARAESASA